MTLPFVIVTNSEYSYLWDILSDLYRNFESVIICVDENNISYKFPDNFQVMFYDRSLNYTKRMYSIISRIDHEIIYLTHDIDLLINCDLGKLHKYCDLLIKHNLDRISMGVFSNNQEVISENEVEVCRLFRRISRNFYTPLDHAPSIYRTSSLREIYSKFLNESYGSFEQNSSIQEFIVENYKFFGIRKNDNVSLVYHRGFVFTEDISILHLTVQGKFLPFDYYFDLKHKVFDLSERYNLTMIQMHEDCGLILRQEI